MIEDTLVERLISDYGFTRREAKGGIRLVEGRCPSCAKKEAFTPPGNPWLIICPRMNKCGVKTFTRRLYPDLQKRFTEHHPATKENPNATAEAYLRSRRIDPAQIKGWFTQSSRRWKQGETWVEYPSVRFQLTNGSACHRLIDYTGDDKNRFEGPYQGECWEAPEAAMPTLPAGEKVVPIRGGRTVYMTEGIIDALSLCVAGYPAISNISAGHAPTAWLEQAGKEGVRVIIAQDNDRAGHKGIRKLMDACQERGVQFQVALAPEGLDWNELLVRGDLDAERKEDTINAAHWRGRLFLADTPATYYAEWKESPKGVRRGPLFTFSGNYYRATAGDGEHSGTEIRRVSDFTIEPVYFMRRPGAPGRSEYTARLRIVNHTLKHEINLNGKEVTSNRDFKQAVWSNARAMWLGTQQDLDALILFLIEHEQAPVVQEINVVGYEPEGKVYLFPGLAYDQAGKAHTVDESGFFNLGGKRYALNATEDEKAYTPDPSFKAADLAPVIQGVHAVFGSPGMAAMGFFAASLFAQQFSDRPSSRFFPFLSIHGSSAGTGKTSLQMILNRLMGRSLRSEGISVTGVDTAKGVTRQMAGLSNLPIGLLEMDPVKAVRFDLPRLLPLFNREPLQIRATKSNDLATSSVKLMGTLVFVQNFEPFLGEAQKSRVVSLLMNRKLEGKRLDANRRLLALPGERLAVFRHWLLTNREKVFADFSAKYDTFEQKFRDEGVSHGRVGQTHAVVAAGTQVALDWFLDGGDAQALGAQTFTYLVEQARAKVTSLHGDSDYLSLFFDTVRHLLSLRAICNHSQIESEVWLSMSEIKHACEKDHHQLNWQQVFQELDGSPKLKFKNTPKHTLGGTKRVWGFDKSVLD